MSVTKSILGPGEYNEKDLIMIELAARGASGKEIATEMGYSEKHIYRRLAEPKIRDGIKDMCRAITTQRKRRMASHWDKMENVFLDVMNDVEAGPFARVAAATQVKNMVFQIADQDLQDELEEIRQKIQVLEQRTRTGEIGAVEVVDPQDSEE